MPAIERTGDVGGGRAGLEPLTADRIAAEALDLVDSDGLEGLSVRKLAARLGCSAMSLYHHYPGKGHLMDAMLDSVILSAEFPSHDLPWDERLAIMARDFRALALAHPNFFPFIATHRMNTATGLRWINEAIGAFRDAGFDDETAARLFRVFGYYVVGASLDETVGDSRGPTAATPMPDAQIAEPFPNFAAARPFFQSGARQATFDLGIRVILDTARKAAEQ